MSDDPKTQDEPGSTKAASDGSKDASVRATVELPRVILGNNEVPREAPRERVLPGRLDARWLIYPAYLAGALGAGISVNFAIDSGEWAVGPVLLGWAMLSIWEWIYGVAYRYRRPILKYSALLMIVGLSAALAGVCLDRAPTQKVITAGTLVERAHTARLEGAAALTLLSSLLILAHVTVLGRGYRRVKRRDTTDAPS